MVIRDKLLCEETVMCELLLLDYSGHQHLKATEPGSGRHVCLSPQRGRGEGEWRDEGKCKGEEEKKEDKVRR